MEDPALKSFRTLLLGLLAGFLLATVLNPTLAVFQEALPYVAKACLMTLARTIDPEPPLDRSPVVDPPLIGSAVEPTPMEPEVIR